MSQDEAMLRAQAIALRDFADLIDRGPTFPMPSSIFSAMAREVADSKTDTADRIADGGSR